MCQYTSRCSVATHRPGTQCPYSGRVFSYSRGSGSGWTAAAASTPHKPDEARRYRRATASSGISGLDLLVVIVVARSWDRFYEDTGLVGVILAVLAVLVPFALAGWLTSTCTAWNGSKEGRCLKRRLGWRRCEESTHGRTRQLITLPEVAAVLSVLIGVANAVFLIRLAA